MPNRMTLRDQISNALDLAMTDCGPFGKAVLEEVKGGLFHIPEEIAFDVPTLKEMLERKHKADQ